MLEASWPLLLLKCAMASMAAPVSSAMAASGSRARRTSRVWLAFSFAEITDMSGS